MGFLGLGRKKAKPDWPVALALVEDVSKSELERRWVSRTEGSESRHKLTVECRVDPADGPPLTLRETRIFAAEDIPTRGGQVKLAWNPENPDDFVILEDTNETFAREGERRRALARDGRRAPALVVDCRATGRVSRPVGGGWEPEPAKERREVEVTFLVFPAGEKPFRAARRHWDPARAPMIAPGYEALFVYDESDPLGNNVAMFCSAEGRAKGTRPPLQLAEQAFNGEYGSGGQPPVAPLPEDAHELASARPNG